MLLCTTASRTCAVEVPITFSVPAICESRLVSSVDRRGRRAPAWQPPALALRSQLLGLHTELTCRRHTYCQTNRVVGVILPYYDLIRAGATGLPRRCLTGLLPCIQLPVAIRVHRAWSATKRRGLHLQCSGAVVANMLRPDMLHGPRADTFRLV